MKPELSILVPAYNEEQNLHDHLPELIKAATSCTSYYEILVVDDGSTDRGPKLVQDLMSANRRIRLVRHARNLGPGAAIPTGLFWARGDWLMLVPADLACEPGQIPLLWQAREGADVVVGLRSDRQDYPLWRKALSVAYIAAVQKLGGSDISQFNYLQMYRRRIFVSQPVESRGVFVTAEIILRAERNGRYLAQVPMTYRPRLSGQASGANPRAMLRALLEMASYFTGW